MNTDIRIDVGFLDHWKTDAIIIECGAEGVLSLIRLWVFAAQNKPNGRLDGIKAELIERVAKWRGEPGKLLKCLIETRFIEQDEEGVWCLHDWLAHNPYAANAEWRRERAKKANAARRNKDEGNTGYKPATSALLAHSEPAPPPPPPPAPPPAPAPAPAPPPAPAPAPDQGKNRVKGKESVGPRERATPAPTRKTSLPPDFAITPQVQAWAEQHGYGDLERHLESFKDKATARSYQYADWDAAFRNAIRDDWAKLREIRPNPPPNPRNRATPTKPQALAFADILEGKETRLIEGECSHVAH